MDVRKHMTEQQLQQIMDYKPPSILQDMTVLPELKPIDLEFFEDLDPKLETIDNIKVYYDKRLNGVKITIKSDISDLN